MFDEGGVNGRVGAIMIVLSLLLLTNLLTNVNALSLAMLQHAGRSNSVLATGCSSRIYPMSSSAVDEVCVRRAITSDADDEAAYQCVIAKQDRLYWPEWAARRQLSARWDTWADVHILIATIQQPSGFEIVGTAEIIGPLDASQPLPRRCLLRDVWVDPVYRRQGLARRLIKAAERSSAELGVDCLSLEVQGENAPALALYTDLGFAEWTGDRLADRVTTQPFTALAQTLPGWMRGTIVLAKRLERGSLPLF